MNIRILSTAAASAALAFALPATAQQMPPAGDQTTPQTMPAPTDPTTTADPAGLPPAPYPTDRAQPAPDSAGTDTATTPDTTASDAAAPAEEKKRKKKK